MEQKIHKTEIKSIQKSTNVPKRVIVENGNKKDNKATYTNTYLVENKLQESLIKEKFKFKAFEPIEPQTTITRDYDKASTRDETFSGSGETSGFKYNVFSNAKSLKSHTNVKNIENTTTRLNLAKNVSEVMWKNFKFNCKTRTNFYCFYSS